MVAVLLIAFFALLIFGTPIITALMGSSLLSFAMYSTKDFKGCCTGNVCFQWVIFTACDPVVCACRCADVQRRDQQKTNQVL